MDRFFKLLLACILAVSGMIMPALAEGGAEAEGDGTFIGVHVDFTTATDEELAEAAARIKEEQQSRITTVIGLSETELTLRRGGSKKLKATVTDLKEGVRAGRFQWKTSDKKIAAVSGGTVKGIGPGEATVTCTNVLSDGTEITAECRVRVTVPVSAVKAGEKTVELGIGQVLQTSFTVTPEQATERGLKYESSDESVVTVDENGVLSGIGAGTADVTAFSTDGTDKHASVKVRVSRRDDVGVEKTDAGSGISVKLTGFRSDEGRSVFTPEKGSVFVYPAFELQNGGSEGVNVDTGSFSVMCDGTYRSYSFNAAQCEEQSLNGMLAPGEMRTGEVGLEIPKKWKEITLTLSFGWYGEELTFVLFNR